MLTLYTAEKNILHEIPSKVSQKMACGAEPQSRFGNKLTLTSSNFSPKREKRFYKG